MRILKKLRDDRGAVLAMVAVSLIALLGIGGLALDSGRAYLMKAQFAKAVDAGVLAGARSLRLGQAEARRRALDMAALNGLPNGAGGVTVNVTFGVNEFGEQTVRLDASRTVPTILMPILGIDHITVRSAAVAAVPPVDMVLVLDQSGSLASAGAWDDLQLAAKQFVGNFDDVIDQMGLVSFQLRGTERFSMAGGFKSTIKNKIDQMQSAGDTNVGEALRLAENQLTSAAARERSAKVVVFFTDGRPTAFRDYLGGQDRALAVYVTGSSIRGYFNNPDNLPTDVAAGPNGCNTGQSSCFGYSENQIRERGKEMGLERADSIRDEGILIYSIGLGNPGESDPLKTPDMDYLRLIANEDGVSNSGQPEGKAYFAPSAAELRQVFDQVAQDLLVRLAQ